MERDARAARPVRGNRSRQILEAVREHLARRLRELAVRRSLGARPRDLLRSALVEQGILAAAGAAVGLALAPSVLGLVERALPPGPT